MRYKFRLLARSSGLPFIVIFPNHWPSLNFPIVSIKNFLKLKKCLSWKSSDYFLGIIDIKILWCATESTIFSVFRALTVSLLHFFACIFIKTKMAVVLWCSSLWLQFIKNKDQYSRPFSQARNAGNKVATFHPGHNVALKNLSYLWKTVLFKLKTALALKWDEVSIPCQRNLEKNRFLLFSMRSFLRNKALLELSYSLI